MRANPENADIDIGALFVSLKRNWLFILLGSLLFAVLVWAVALTLPSYYRSEARILIESRETVYTRPTGSEQDRLLLDPEAVKSQVELVGAQANLRKVAEDLKLADYPEFYRPSVGPLKQLLITLGLRPDPRNIPAEDQVLANMRANLQIYNVSGTRLIAVQFVSRNAQLAAKVANAIANEYIVTEVAAKQQLTGDATSWLAPAIEELTPKVREAEAKVADYRAAHDLLNTSANTTLATQQMSDISSELSRVKAQRAASEARAESIRNALAKGAALNTLPEIIAAGSMQQLNERRSVLMAEIANLSVTLLDGHPRLQAARAQLADVDRQIRQEGTTILKSLDNEVLRARDSEQEQTRELNRLKAQAAQAGSQEVELRALEREATAQRDLLQSYLARYREASTHVEVSNPSADARISSEADVAGEPFYPKVLPMVGMSFFAGLLLLSVFVLLRELLSGRAMRPAPDKGHNLWGDENNYFAGSDKNRKIPQENMVQSVINSEPDHPVVSDGHVIPDTQNANEYAMKRPDIDVETIQRIYNSYSVTDTAVSADVLAQNDLVEDDLYAPNGVAAIASRLMLQERRRIVLVSPEGDAGSAGSVHLLRELADRSLRVLLVDLSGSGAVSSVMLDGKKTAGITDLLLGTEQFTGVIHHDLYSEADVIPTGMSDPQAAMQHAERLPVIFEALETAYDFVLVETGAVSAAQLLNLNSDVTVFVMNVVDSENDAVAQTALGLHEAGQEDVTILIVPQV